MFINKSFPNDEPGMIRAIEFAYEKLKENRIVYVEGLSLIHI